ELDRKSGLRLVDAGYGRYRASLERREFQSWHSVHPSDRRANVSTVATAGLSRMRRTRPFRPLFSIYQTTRLQRMERSVRARLGRVRLHERMRPRERIDRHAALDDARYGRERRDI